MAQQLAALKQTIDSQLAAWGERHLDQDQFESQIVSFVVGNAFDVFEHRGTVTAETVRENFSARLDIAR